MKKLIPALCMLLIAATLMGTSTFAWFSMNTKVTVTGMSVTTKVNSNLLISADTTEANFTTTRVQSQSVKVEPVSTVDGKAFYYTNTKNVVAGGDAKADNYILYDAADTSAFNTNYGTTGFVGYVDYTMYIKATSSEDNSKVVLSTCNLLYNNTAVSEKAWRVAMFVNKSADNPETCVAASLSTTLGDAVSILTPASAVNFSTGKAVSGADALGDVTYGTAAVVDGDIDKGVSRYYYVTLRFWLEGEDKTCNVETFADLTNSYTLELEFEIGTSVTAVTNIGSTVPTT